MSKRRSRLNFIQKPYFKKSHHAMDLDIDGKSETLLGDKLTLEVASFYQQAQADRGK